ncbi:hypothetical protein FDP41_011713 [Naegleria fowleri]|uniref:Acyl-CoA dehydrogenase family member 11 n=1 Tax=Naegleria fowleri TaxID=5763 RepID=A0A6A5C4Y6_NAEFO|nr:uncharacterized protein FDP41_011713 [Naegleria fowleri]KAF0981852.1 hypothetical protein FDP41_011713 [Naegleria fowleri]
MSFSQSAAPLIHIRPQHLFNVEAFAKYLQEHATELLSINNNYHSNKNNNGSVQLALKSIQQFSDGQSNPSFKVVCTISLPQLHKDRSGGASSSVLTKELVLRKKPPGKLLPSAHDIYREYAIMKSLHSIQFPVPYPYFYCRDEKIIGTEFYVMEFIQGRIFKDGTFAEMHKSSVELLKNHELTMTGPEKLTPQDRREMMTDFIRTLSRLHRVDFMQFELLRPLFASSQRNKATKESTSREETAQKQHDSSNTKNTYYERQIATWTRQYLASETHENDSMNRLMKWLPKNIPKETESDKLTIVHGDYKFDNVIYHPTENRIIAVLDWELSTLGHPIADLSYSCMYYHFPRIPGFSGLRGTNFQQSGVLTEKECLDLYTSFTQRSKIDKWHFYLTFSIFRLVGITQGVYKRYKQGNASSDYALHIGMLAGTLSDVAWELIVNAEGDNLTICEGGIQFGLSPKALRLKTKLEKFMKEHVYPAEVIFQEQHHKQSDRWQIPPIIEELKQKAKEQGLWNFFLCQHNEKEPISTVEYAILAEVMGRSFIASEVFNCNAPDTGNMEVLMKFGTPEQKEQYLKPLLNGDIRSCFSMTEYGVSSSDATNVSSTIKKSEDGKHYIINGVKWFITGAGDPRCKFTIFMGATNPNHPNPHQRQSMVLIPMDAPGVKLEKPASTFGLDDAPSGHWSISFTNVKVPVSNLIFEEGQGFNIAQARLGPGRVHHCMRLIGLSERVFELMVQRAKQRKTFGKNLSQHAIIQQYIAESRIEIEQARLLVLKAAYMLDQVGAKHARSEIAMIKIAVPRACKNVADRAIQVFGAEGLLTSSSDIKSPLNEVAFSIARVWIGARQLQIADGPDEVHMINLAKHQLSKM